MTLHLSPKKSLPTINVGGGYCCKVLTVLIHNSTVYGITQLSVTLTLERMKTEVFFVWTNALL